MKTIVIACLLLISVAVQAQIQVLPIHDCCEQAIAYKHDLDVMTGRFNESVKLLEQTRRAGNDVIQEKDVRLKALQGEANSKLTDANGRETKLQAAYALSDAKLKLARSELEKVLMLPWFGNWGKKATARRILKQLNTYGTPY